MRSRVADARRKSPRVPRYASDWLTVESLFSALSRIAEKSGQGMYLDVGCGNKPYRSLFPQATLYFGVDITHRNSAADIVANVEHILPFAAESFDCVICTQVIEHIRSPNLFLAEAHRVLKPEGQLILSAPMYWPHHEEPYDFYRYTLYGLEYLITNVGFEVQEIIQQGGAWTVVGQSLALTVDAALHFRTFGIKAVAVALLNTIFHWLDQINYQPRDTTNFAILARKRQSRDKTP